MLMLFGYDFTLIAFIDIMLGIVRKNSLNACGLEQRLLRRQRSPPSEKQWQTGATRPRAR
jgi:hypothetical protein